MSTLTEAVSVIEHALSSNEHLDIFGGCDVAGYKRGFTLIVTDAQTCREQALAQAPTLTETLIALAGQLENAGYKIAVSTP